MSGGARGRRPEFLENSLGKLSERSPYIRQIGGQEGTRERAPAQMLSTQLGNQIAQALSTRSLRSANLIRCGRSCLYEISFKTSPPPRLLGRRIPHLRCVRGLRLRLAGWKRGVVSRSRQRYRYAYARLILIRLRGNAHFLGIGRAKDAARYASARKMSGLTTRTSEYAYATHGVAGSAEWRASIDAHGLGLEATRKGGEDSLAQMRRGA